MSNTLVTKSNHLIEAGYKLSLNEQRLILSAIAQLDGRKPMPQDNDFNITAAAFSETFDMPMKQAYETLNDAASRLYERDIKTYDRIAQTREKFRWVDKVKYWDGEAKVTLSFSRWIIPYLTMLHRQFTRYELKQVAQLKTAYAIRFYELLVQFMKTGERYITLEHFRELLELKQHYPRFYDLKKYVITPSIIDINEKTNLIVEWDFMKKGKNIVGLIFIFQEKETSRSKHNQKQHNGELQSARISNQTVKVSSITLEKAKYLISEARTGWDLSIIEEEFYAYMKKAGLPKNLEGAFIGFVKKKIAKRA